MDLGVSNGLVQKAIVHRVFGSLFGLWMGFLFARDYPDFSNWSIGYVLYTVFTIGLITYFLHTGFSRNSLGERLLVYLTNWLFTGILLVGLTAISILAFEENPPITTWELSFIAFILLFWQLVAEFVDYRDRRVSELKSSASS